MLRRLFTLLSAASLVLCGPILVGCGSGPRHPVELQAYNAATGEPLGGVRVVRWDYSPDSRPTRYPGPTDVTGNDGLIGSAIPEYAPSFIFSEEGFMPAEVRVDGEAAYVASPSAGNRAHEFNLRRSTFGRLVNTALPPILYEREVPARPLIRVPLWPIVKNPSPATAPARPDGADARPPEPFLKP